ncbi:hypothetical protein [Leifsonia shinshuensis]|uniref:Uncharacterized protein n=1 Tax=Leifsonia shinshuensis TaxID=150026 RepID=A0A7G6Y665_9MICO|nr:hypothetical protein [Leifsonia shinshuensis]QNE33980.1 hypothetical protein F1C12_01685 [Leifsonia shinshuensis]
MADRNLNEVLEEVGGRLTGPSWMRVRSDDRAEWFGHFVSGIALAVGLRPIEHLDSGVRIDGAGVFSAKVVVFTDKTIVFADAAGRSTEPYDVETVVVARPRAGLAQLTISDANSAFRRDLFDPWPGDFTVTAEWSYGTKVTFPLSPIETDDHRARFSALYAALIDALGD